MDTDTNTANEGAMELRHDFEDCKPEYRLVYRGNEFAPEFNDGDEIVFSTELDHKHGDVIALWLKPEALNGRPQVSVWRVEMALPSFCKVPFTPHPKSEAHPVLIVRSAGDGKCRAIKGQDILGVHPKIGLFYNQQIARDEQEGEAAS